MYSATLKVALSYPNVEFEKKQTQHWFSYFIIAHKY